MSMDTTPLSPSTPPLHPALGLPAPKRRRRWWVYALWIFGSLVGLVIAAFVSIWLYWNSLIKTYTSTTPKPIPQSEGTEEQYAELKQRWDAYALLFIRRREPIPPFEITGQELNLFTSQFGPFQKQSYAEILPDKIRLRFSLPLDQTRNPSLKGRFLNGVATFHPVMTNKHLSIRLTTAEANNKALPGWILKRLQSANMGEAFNRRPEFDLAFRALDRVELQTDKITLHPSPNGR
jgi:hypothetical protein